MERKCFYCKKPIKSRGGNRISNDTYLCDECFNRCRNEIIKHKFQVTCPSVYEFSPDEIRTILSGNGDDFLEALVITREEDRLRRHAEKEKQHCCVCGNKDCSGGKVIKDDYLLCERCAENYTMTAANGSVTEAFFAEHDKDFFISELGECVNPHNTITFNFKTRKIYLKDALMKKNYKVVSFSDIVGFKSEMRANENTYDKKLIKKLHVRFRYNGAEINYYRDNTTGNPQEYEDTLDCFSRIPEVQKIANGAYGASVTGSAQDNVKMPRVTCPKCGGINCTPISESKTTGSDFYASKGCCGYLLLGPIGILCGKCGAGTETTNTTYWVCSNCGNKFRN